MSSKRKTSGAKICTECKHSRFDPIWGEYKCVKRARYVYDMHLDALYCEDYEYDEKKFEEDEEND